MRLLVVHAEAKNYQLLIDILRRYENMWLNSVKRINYLYLNVLVST